MNYELGCRSVLTLHNQPLPLLPAYFPKPQTSPRTSSSGHYNLFTLVRLSTVILNFGKITSELYLKAAGLGGGSEHDRIHRSLCSNKDPDSQLIILRTSENTPEAQHFYYLEHTALHCPAFLVTHWPIFITVCADYNLHYLL